MTKKAMTNLTTRTTNNVYEKIDLEYCKLKNYVTVAEAVATELLPSGWDWQYAVINKLTGVVEARTANLPMAVMIMQNMQQMLDKVVTGEANGYAVPPETPIKSQG